jgi:hypothetical protein
MIAPEPSSRGVREPCLRPTEQPSSSSTLTAMLFSSSILLPWGGRDPPSALAGTLASIAIGQFGIFVCVQPVTGWHVSVVHGSPSEQSPHARQAGAPGAG